MMKKLLAIIYLIIFFLLTIADGNGVHAATTSTPTQRTPSATETPTLTPSNTPTTTLMPLPAITLIFPASTTTGTPTITPVPPTATATPSPPSPADLATLSPRLKVLVVFVVLLWLILAGFAIIYIRQLR